MSIGSFYHEEEKEVGRNLVPYILKTLDNKNGV